VSHRYTQSWCVLLVTQGTRLSRQSQIQNISQNKIEKRSSVVFICTAGAGDNHRRKGGGGGETNVVIVNSHSVFPSVKEICRWGTLLFHDMRVRSCSYTFNPNCGVNCGQYVASGFRMQVLRRPGAIDT